MLIYIHHRYLQVNFKKSETKLRDKGYLQILFIVSLSSKLSGTYQGALLARDLVEGINVEV